MMERGCVGDDIRDSVTFLVVLRVLEDLTQTSSSELLCSLEHVVSDRPVSRRCGEDTEVYLAN